MSIGLTTVSSLIWNAMSTLLCLRRWPNVRFYLMTSEICLKRIAPYFFYTFKVSRCSVSRCISKYVYRMNKTRNEKNEANFTLYSGRS